MDQGGKPAPKRIEAEMPAEMARAFNLMAHPLAGMAAMSAIGFGMASQALGMWAGAMSGALAASRQLAPKVAEALEPVAVRFDGGSANPAPRAKADVLTLIKDARTAVEARARVASEASVTAPAAVAKVAPAEAVAAVAKPVEAPAKAEAVAKVTRKPKAPARAKAVAQVAAPAEASPKAKAKLAQSDDLKAISGVGPKLEQVLNGMGISTYGQIAAMTAEEIATIEDRLGFKGRIGRDDWVGQAKALANASRKA